MPGKLPVGVTPDGETPSKGEAYTHMTVLAESNTGLSNLQRIVSTASIDGSYQKPRADRELIAANSVGLIGTTGCLGGEVKTLITRTLPLAGIVSGFPRTVPGTDLPQ